MGKEILKKMGLGKTPPFGTLSQIFGFFLKWHLPLLLLVIAVQVLGVTVHIILLGVFCESLSENYTVVIPNLMDRDRQKCIF